MTLEDKLCIVGRQWSIIPMNFMKRPMIKWLDYQKRRATADEIAEWLYTYRPVGWAVITGEISDVIILDFDGTKGAIECNELGLSPHVLTPSGGCHVYVKYPGFKVRPQVRIEGFNSIDIRGDASYALFVGPGYRWVRKQADLEEFNELPQSLQEAIQKIRETNSRLFIPPAARKKDPEELMWDAVIESHDKGRNNAGYRLARRMAFHGYTLEEAIEIGRAYCTHCPTKNTKGDEEPYGIEEFEESARQAFSREIV